MFVRFIARIAIFATLLNFCLLAGCATMPVRPSMHAALGTDYPGPGGPAAELASAAKAPGQ